MVEYYIVKTIGLVCAVWRIDLSIWVTFVSSAIIVRSKQYNTPASIF